jgi:glycosyltransferase involved in cell wall biosynthesis
MRISIITPVYNAEKSIEKTILSVLRQREYIFQYIIIDGGSTDKTLSIIEKYQDQIDLLISEKDKGISDAFNKGIQLSEGDLIGIVAANDQLIKDSLPSIVRLYDGVSDLICGNIIDFNGIRYRRRSSDPDLSKLKMGTSIMHPATFIRKDAYSKYGLYSLQYKCAMDRELLLRFFIKGAKFQIVNVDFSFFDSCGGISSSNPTKFAFPEDCDISIKYGMSQIQAKSFCFFLNRDIMFRMG